MSDEEIDDERMLQLFYTQLYESLKFIYVALNIRYDIVPVSAMVKNVMINAIRIMISEIDQNAIKTLEDAVKQTDELIERELKLRKK